MCITLGISKNATSQSWVQPRRTAHIEVRPLKVFSAVAAIDGCAIGRRAKVEFACTCEHSVYRALVSAVEWTGSTGFCPECMLGARRREE